jgi:murein DD-endopeptidase MepM/ murein hydrolase activator NlpD
VVRSGDTVYSIARRYKVDMADLVRLNGIPASYQISPGQRLKLPGQAAAVAGLPAANGTKLSSAAAAPQPVAQATPAAWTQSSQASVVMMPPPEITGPIPEPPARAGSKFLWPVEGKLLKNYGPKQGGLHNDGINIAAARGSPVRAADNGVVAYVGNENDAILVGRGAKVKRGQTVARVGDSGSVVTPQLHFEVRRGTRAVDPAKQLGPRQAAQNW